MLSVSFLGSFMPGAIPPEVRVELSNLLSPPSHLKDWEQGWNLPSQVGERFGTEPSPLPPCKERSCHKEEPTLQLCEATSEDDCFI